MFNVYSFNFSKSKVATYSIFLVYFAEYFAKTMKNSSFLANVSGDFDNFSVFVKPMYFLEEVFLSCCKF